MVCGFPQEEQVRISKSKWQLLIWTYIVIIWQLEVGISLVIQQIIVGGLFGGTKSWAHF